LRICFVAHLNDLSGANRSLIDLIKVLKKLDHYILVICPRKGELSNKLEEIGIDYKVIHSGTWVGDKIKESIFKKYFKIFLNIIAEWRYYFFFKNNDLNIEIVHFNSFVYGCGAESLSKLNIPYVWHIREFPEDTFNLSFYDKEKSYNLIKGSETIIAISQAIYSRFKENFGSKMKLIYNGINSEDINIEYSENNENDNNVLMVGAVARDKGQLEAVKGINEILQTKKNIEIKLHLVGEIIDDNYYKEIKEFINNNKINDNIIFHGYHSNLNKFRKQSEIVLVCSKFEAFGRVTVEAMLSKQLVIGANTGGTTEIIDDFNTGLLYKQGDYIDLSKKIEYALNNKKETKKMIDNAYEIANKEFIIEKTAKKIDETYTQIRRQRNA